MGHHFFSFAYTHTLIYMDISTPIHSAFHRILEWFLLEGIPKDHSVQLPAKGSDTFHKIELLKTLSNLFLSTSNDGPSTTFLRSLFHCLITLMVKKEFFAMWILNLSTHILIPLPLMLSLQTLVKSLSQSLFCIWKSHMSPRAFSRLMSLSS